MPMPGAFGNVYFTEADGKELKAQFSLHSWLLCDREGRAGKWGAQIIPARPTNPGGGKEILGQESPTIKLLLRPLGSLLEPGRVC